MPSSIMEAAPHVLDDPATGGCSQAETTNSNTAAGRLHGLVPSS